MAEENKNLEMSLTSRKDDLETIFDTFSIISGLDLTNPSREIRYVYRRYIFWQIIHDLNIDCTLNRMARRVGREHASVISGKKVFKKKVISKPEYLDMYTKGLKHCTKAIGMPVDADMMDKDLKEMMDNTWIEKEMQIKALRKKLEMYNSSDTIKEIISLTPEQYEIFEERVVVMLKSIKSIKTYSNTDRSSFNVAS